MSILPIEEEPFCCSPHKFTVALIQKKILWAKTKPKAKQDNNNFSHIKITATSVKYKFCKRTIWKSYKRLETHKIRFIS